MRRVGRFAALLLWMALGLFLALGYAETMWEMWQWGKR